MLYYEMLLRFDGRNQKRIAMISFFVQQFRTKVIFINAREMLAFQRAFLKMTLVRTQTFAKGKSQRDDFANEPLNSSCLLPSVLPAPVRYLLSYR